MTALKRIVLPVLLLMLLQTAKATVISSVRDGFWESPATWSTTTVPQPNDTILVDHYIQFTDTIYISPDSGQLTIDSCGTLCGDACFNGSFTNYGKMYIGCFILNAPSFNYDTIMSNNTGGSGIVAGGFLQTYGYVSVGPNTPPCVFPANKTFGNACQRIISGIQTTERFAAFTIYPNPANNVINISAISPAQHPVNIRIYDISGRLVANSRQTISGTLALPVAELCPGYYWLTVSSEQLSLATSKFAIVR